VGVRVVAQLEDERLPSKIRKLQSAQSIGVVGGKELEPEAGRETIYGVQ
jgi:hypothetical protein